MTVVPYETGGRAWIALQNPAVELANAIAGTDFVPTSLQGNPAAITAAILYGDEVGLGPMMSLAKISVINGRSTLAAEAQRALILQAGHDLWIEESTTTKCTVAGRRRDSDQTSRITWTMDDAKRANLAGKPPWRMYPRQMLLARASAELARAIFADAIGGLAATEEMEDEPATDAPVGNGPPPKPPGARRRRQHVTQAAPTTPDAPAPSRPEPPPLPGEEEEPPPPEPEEPPPEPMDEPTRNRLMMLFRERGFNESEQRHAFASFMLGRDIGSSIELTADDAAHLISTLEQQQPRPNRPPPDGS
jgi:hypothetical protein